MDVEAQDDGILAKIIVRGRSNRFSSIADSRRSKETDRKLFKSVPESELQLSLATT
jgi:hypothetical protein